MVNPSTGGSVIISVDSIVETRSVETTVVPKRVAVGVVWQAMRNDSCTVVEASGRDVRASRKMGDERHWTDRAWLQLGFGESYSYQRCSGRYSAYFARQHPVVGWHKTPGAHPGRRSFGARLRVGSWIVKEVLVSSVFISPHKS